MLCYILSYATFLFQLSKNLLNRSDLYIMQCIMACWFILLRSRCWGGLNLQTNHNITGVQCPQRQSNQSVRGVLCSCRIWIQLIREQQRALAVNDVKADVQHSGFAGRTVHRTVCYFSFLLFRGSSHLHRRFILRVWKRFSVIILSNTKWRGSFGFIMRLFL